jgi:predicted dehydrogenase
VADIVSVDNHPGLTSAVLVGFGSVGSFFGQVLAERYPKLAIVARSDASHARIAEAHPEAVAARNLTDLDEQGWDWPGSLVVIASWGPSHSDYFHALADRGVRHILCEKPLADSVAGGAEMVARAKGLGIALGTHQQRAYSGLVTGLRGLALEHGLGEPFAVLVHAGAIGLVTMGVHYIGFAIELFGVGPSSVVSTARGEGINPRSPELRYYGGTAIWSFTGGREAVFSFSNASSVGATIQVEYRNAIATVAADNTVVIWRRDPAFVESDPRVVRTSDPSDLVYEGPIPGAMPLPQASIGVIEEVERGDVRTFLPEAALESVGACLGALAAGESGRSVQLPIDPESEIGLRRWPVS